MLIGIFLISIYPIYSLIRIYEKLGQHHFSVKEQNNLPSIYNCYRPKEKITLSNRGRTEILRGVGQYWLKTNALVC